MKVHKREATKEDYNKWWPGIY